MDQPAQPPTPKRRRGAPLGNKNALKTGFYSRYYKPVDNSDLVSVSFDGLQDEITMLRVFIRQVIERSQEVESLEDSLVVLRTLSMASFSLSRLVRIQYLISPTAMNEFMKTLDQALSAMSQKLGLPQPSIAEKSTTSSK